jgi:hypothetical protein
MPPVMPVAALTGAAAHTIKIRQSSRQDTFRTATPSFHHFSSSNHTITTRKTQVFPHFCRFPRNATRTVSVSVAFVCARDG